MLTKEHLIDLIHQRNEKEVRDFLINTSGEGAQTIVEYILLHGSEQGIVKGMTDMENADALCCALDWSMGNQDELNEILNEKAESGNYFAVRLLLDAGADPEEALVPAAAYGYDEIIELLLKHGAEVDGREDDNISYAFAYAAHNGHEKVVQALVDAGALPDSVCFLD